MQEAATAVSCMRFKARKGEKRGQASLRCQMRKKIPGVSKGFTLIEVLIAMLLFVTTFVVLLGIYVAIAGLRESSRNMTQAMADVRSVVEQMRNLSVGGLNNITGTDWTQWALDNNLTTLDNEALTVGYTNPAADPLDITVRIDWQERGRDRFATVSTLMTQR